MYFLFTIMASKVFSIALHGLRCQSVEVEADVSRHMPAFILVGLPDAAIQEAKERVRSALENSNLPFPRTKVTVNLAPAHVRKEGTLYDLAIAVSILLAQDSIDMSDQDRNAVFLGELSLGGNVRPVKGVLVAVSFLREQGVKRVYVPSANAKEASYISGIEIIPVTTLRQLLNHLNGFEPIQPTKHMSVPAGKMKFGTYDFADISGQSIAKRALEIAAAGGHNVLLNGIPGSGKTMLARSFMSILPPLVEDEMLEVSKIYSYAGLLASGDSLIYERPFRSPHHSASVASIVGGGTWPKPGEITLAHRGVLFMDEFPEFPRNVLESLRQPLEDKIISVSRVSGSLQFPAHFILIAAQNPCPCGAWGDAEKECVCSDFQRKNYQRKISGPLLDRIDLYVRVYPADRQKLLIENKAESSASILSRVVKARKRQHTRFTSPILLNGHMDHTLLKKVCILDAATEKVLLQASKKLQLSARSFYKTIKIARTIADLAERKAIDEADVLEALRYRPT